MKSIVAAMEEITADCTSFKREIAERLIEKFRYFNNSGFATIAWRWSGRHDSRSLLLGVKFMPFTAPLT